MEATRKRKVLLTINAGLRCDQLANLLKGCPRTASVEGRSDGSIEVVSYAAASASRFGPEAEPEEAEAAGP